MKGEIVIDIDSSSGRLELSGDLTDVLSNARLGISLRRLRAETVGGHILIPFDERTKVKTLNEVQELLHGFSFVSRFSERAQSELVSYVREQSLFREFSDKARNIRNSKFDDYPDLVRDFDFFQKTLKHGLKRPLYPLQLLSSFHMAFSQNACNFAVPGAGKTAIVFGAYTFLKNLPSDHPKHVEKLLVIGPLASFAPWEKEFEACFGRKPESQRLSGDDTISRAHKEQHLYSANPAELTLVWHGTVDSLQNDIVAFLKKNKAMVVVDEAHRIKNPDGVWGRSAIAIAKEARARVVLTGTPVPNGYQDLYNLFQYLYPFKFKEILGFHLANLEDMTKNSDPESNRVKEFTNNISPYFIRIKKADLKLPPTEDYRVEIEMDPDQREIYDFIETKYVRSFQGDSSGGVKDLLNRARLIRLRQAATNPSLLLKPLAEAFDSEDEQSPLYRHLPNEFQEDSYVVAKIRNYSKQHVPAKFVNVRKLYEESVVPLNGKVIVWSIFIQNAKELQSYLASAGIRAELLIGEVEQLERERIIDAFDDPSNDEFRVVIANPFAVSESISLHHGCHNAIYLERDYNCASFLQSKDRIHRYGLEPNQITKYYYLSSMNSIDEVIDVRLQEKVRRMEKIIDEEIPLLTRIDDSDETDLIKALLIDYAKRA